MTNLDAAGIEEFTALNTVPVKELTGFFCCDLLSHAMGRLPQGACWCTVMGNVNTVAVAALADAGCVVLCHGIPASPEMLQRADENGVLLLSTQLAEFDACLALAKAGGFPLT